MTVVSLCVGCGAGVVRDEVDPTTTAQQRCQSRLGEALERAQLAEENLDAVTFRLRYNPVECDCPDWEIELRGDWTRTVLSADNEGLLPALLDRANIDDEDENFVIYAVVGGLGSDWTTASTGMRYRLLHVLEWIENAETVDRQQVD